jgi:tRNA dimethylallyltransferase
MDNAIIDLIVVLGPTASGKTRLGVEIASVVGGEIISADSRQIYRGMDIGTGKDLHEYGPVPYHLIDILDPGEQFSVFQFQRLFIGAWRDITRRGKMPVMVGGTGLYLDAVIRGYAMAEVAEDLVLKEQLVSLSTTQLQERLRKANPRLHNTTDLLDRDRLVRAIEIAEYQALNPPEPLPPFKPLIFGISWDRQLLRKRISDRLQIRMAQGMVAEVEKLLSAGVSHQFLDYCGLEYRFLSAFIRGELTKNDMVQKLAAGIADFAKRQETWFRRMEKHGVPIVWLNGAGDLAEEARMILLQRGLVR